MKDYRINKLTEQDVKDILPLNSSIIIDMYSLRDKGKTANSYFVDQWDLPISVKNKRGKARQHLAIVKGKDGWDLIASDNHVTYYNLKSEYLAKYLNQDRELHFLNKKQRKDYLEELTLCRAFNKVATGEFHITMVE